MENVIFDLLYEFLHKRYAQCTEKDGVEKYQKEWLSGQSKQLWREFCATSIPLEDKYEIIDELIKNIVTEIDRKDKVRCQYCRIDEGLSVTSPIKAENLCRYHRNEYEEKYYDKTRDYVKDYDKR
jgi:hypothetical protein